MENMKILTVLSYGAEPGESYRVTLQPMNVSMVTAYESLVERQGMSLRKVIIRFAEEGGCELYINGDDLRILEEAIGFYTTDY